MQKNVTKENSVEQRVYKNICKTLEERFGSKPKETKENIKLHIDELGGEALALLHSFYISSFIKDLYIKRSGTGLTIIITKTQNL